MPVPTASRGAGAHQGRQADPLCRRDRPGEFDQNGDIIGPFRLWRIQNGEMTTVGQMGADAVQAVKAKLPAQ